LWMRTSACWQEADITFPERLWQCLANRELGKAIHLTEHRVPNERARDSTKGVEGVYSPIRGTTIWYNQYPRSSLGLNDQPPPPPTPPPKKKHMVGLITLAAYIAEYGLVGHQWEERSLFLWMFYALV
jgi:hypothetical protein